MSRIGKTPINVPSGVTIRLEPNTQTIHVEGSKGKLSYVYRPEVNVSWDESEKTIACSIDESKLKDKQSRAYWGTVRANIQNMIVGVSQGYEKHLEIVGVGWNAKPMGKSLQLNIGFCHPVELQPPAGVEFEINNNAILIKGHDKQAVGQFAAVVRSKRPPEPYKGKGIKYRDEHIIRKQGKVFGS